jgi:hypothetical protein
VYGRLPKFVTQYAPNGAVVSTNAFYYTNVTTTLSFATNVSYGLLYRTVRAYGSSEAADPISAKFRRIEIDNARLVFTAFATIRAG